MRSLAIARDFSYSAVWMAYGVLLMWVGFWKRAEFLRWQAIVLIGVTILKVFIYDASALQRGYRILAFMILGRDSAGDLIRLSEGLAGAAEERGGVSLRAALRYSIWWIGR